jgi:hypothetical protein
VGDVTKLMTQAGLMVLCAFISPFRAERRMVRELVAEGEFIVIFVDTPIEQCVARDPKGLYILIEACKMNDVDPQAWLVDVLARLPDHPANASQQQKRRRRVNA